MNTRDADSLPQWVSDAAPLPLAFAQVREDPLLDAWVVQQLPPQASIIMIASGGCTLADLVACCPPARIDVVDPNPAQVALARLKIHLLQNNGSADRLAILGHAPLPAREREQRLRSAFQSIGIAPDSMGPMSICAADGPDYCGRYERVFAALRHELKAQYAEVRQLLALRDVQEQARRVAPETPLGRAMDKAFDRALDLPILVRLFGEGATRNRVEPFARHFARRTRHVLATLPAADNPYLWQVLAGQYPAGTPVPWFRDSAPRKLPEITWKTTMMTEALRGQQTAYDFVHLSNILDWLSADEARATLDFTRAALRPGGWTLIRQLNSTLDVPSLGEGFTWHTEQAQTLHARDRSYFYRGLHLGRKR